MEERIRHGRRGRDLAETVAIGVKLLYVGIVAASFAIGVDLFGSWQLPVGDDARPRSSTGT